MSVATSFRRNHMDYREKAVRCVRETVLPV